MSQSVVDSAVPGALPPETPFFSARLTPNRSLGPLGHGLVIGGIALVSILTAIPFVIAGAWPVGGFFGLDLLALIIAFRINGLRARQAEEILLSRVELLLRKIGWRGDVTERRFNPFWVRLTKEEVPEYGISRLKLAEKGRETDIASFLGPQEKAEFATAFQGALNTARGR